MSYIYLSLKRITIILVNTNINICNLLSFSGLDFDFVFNSDYFYNCLVLVTITMLR